MNKMVESKLRRLAMERSDRSDKYEFGLLNWTRMDDNIYVTFLRRDKSGNYMEIHDVYKLDWLI